MKFNEFVAECREKGVLKNLSIYIVSSWVLLQVVALIADAFGYSSSIIVYLLLCLLVGFPLYIYSVWKFQLSENIERIPIVDDAGAPIPGKFARSPFQKIYFTFLTVIGVIALVITVVIAKRSFVNEITLTDIKAGNKIAVLKFDNNILVNGQIDKNYDIVGKMAVDWIIHGITENRVGQVISPEIIDDYTEILKASVFPTGKNNVVVEYLKPSKIIEGEFFLNRNRLLFQCSIRDEIMDKTLISFKPVECDPNSPLDCIEALTKRILGYLVTENNGLNSLQGNPPSFEAYQYLEMAKILAKSQAKSSDYKEYLHLLDSAISADSTFFEPKLYKFMHYYNMGEFKVADSLLSELSRKAYSDDRQQNFINLYNALLDGNFRLVNKYQQKEYNLTPFHLETNLSMMTFSLQLINKPMAVDSVYKVIDTQKDMLQDCSICSERYKIKALSDIELQNYEGAIALLHEFSNRKGYAVLKKVLLRAYIKSGNYEMAEKLLSNIADYNTEMEQLEIYVFASKEFIIVKNYVLANTYLDRIITQGKAGKTNDKESKMVLAESLFLREKYPETEVLLEELLAQDSTLLTQSAMLAVAYQKNKKPARAEALIKSLEGLRNKYQYGNVSYALAQYYAAMADEEKTIAFLRKAVSEGHWYETSSFQNDPFFKEYFQTDGFKGVLSFWH